MDLILKEECCNLNEVVQEFYDYLKSYIFTRVKEQVVTDDLVQEVMVKLVESHQESKEIANVKAWLFQVTRNTIYDYYNRNKLEFHLEEEGNLEGSDEAFQKLMVSDYVVPMIKLLPEEYAVPLMMSDIENLPQKKIAERLNLQLSATKMRIQRARLKLRALFVECCDLEYDKQGNFIGCTIKATCEPLHKVSQDLNSKLM